MRCGAGKDESTAAVETGLALDPGGHRVLSLNSCVELGRIHVLPAKVAAFPKDLMNAGEFQQQECE